MPRRAVIPAPLAQILGSAALTILGASAPAVSNATQAATARGTVVFGGDIVPHGDVLRAMTAHGASSLLAPIAPVLRAADLALANFETPAVPGQPVVRSGLVFNVHADFVRALSDAGIDGVSVANNHSYDHGVDGVGETVRTLRAAGVRPIGGALPGEDPFAAQEFTVARGTLCVFAVTRILNYPLAPQTPGQPRIALARRTGRGEQQALLEAVRASRPHCGAVIVSLHTGVEYQDRPEVPDQTYFRRLADAGADVVIGHHSHVPQPVELYVAGTRSVPIFYSLGNFVSNQGYVADAGGDPWEGGRYRLGNDSRTREGLLAVLRFENAGGTALRLAEFGYVPLWTVNTRWRGSRGDVPAISAGLMPRDGGGERFYLQRWNSIVRRVGAQHLLPDASLPGADESHRLSVAAALANRGRLVRIAASPPVQPTGPGRDPPGQFRR